MPRLIQLRSMLAANDLAETVSFYERLGFELVGTFGDDPANPTWCQVKRDDVALMFTWSEPHDHGDGDVHSHEPALAGSLYIDVDDVDSLFAQLAPSSDWVVYEPQDFAVAHGMREFAVRDPNGYTLMFGQPVD